MKLLNNEEIKLNIDSDETVNSVKKKIFILRNILPESCMKLYYAGIKLEDDHKVKEYKIK